MYVIVIGSVTNTNDVAFLKIPSPIYVTDDGIIIDTNDLHP
jgi:hypothetical protein